MRAQNMGSQRAKRNQASSATDPDAENLSPISCEACRQRKCKCDRKLPCCSQCSQGSSKCIYPESGKRGLPLGYLNQLEQRLAETEAALYGALITLRSLNPTAVAEATAKPESLDKSKAARMDEWSQLPLRHWPDIYHWQASMGNQFIIQQQGIALSVTDSPGFGYNVPASPAIDSPGPTTHRESEMQAHGSAIYAWQPSEESPLGGHYDMNFQPAGVVSSQVYPKGATSGSAVTTPDRLSEFNHATVTSERAERIKQATRAEELSKRNPSIYF